MTFWTLDRLSAALRLQLVGARPAGRVPLRRIGTDTRTIKAGDVFVALRGDQFNGHAFLSAAVERGAAAVVADDPSQCRGLGVPVLLVGDTTRALAALGHYRRAAWGAGGTVVAVAGSNGKTTTKELIAAALGTRLRVHATQGNLNNHVGVPLTLLSIPDSAEVAVIEIGTNHPGEVAALREAVRPDISVVTSIGEEHLEGLGTLHGVLQEESAVFQDADLAVTPRAQPQVAEAARGKARRVIEAGLDAGDVRPDAWGLDASAKGWCTFGDSRLEMPFVGLHNLRNAMLAIAVARACGVPDDMAIAGMTALRTPSMRSAQEPLGGLLLLNDAYNANPASAREALNTMEAISTPRPRVVVLGSMLELGSEGPALHDAIARAALETRADVIAGVGLFVAAFARVAPADSRVVTAEDADALWPLLRHRIPADALVLLKGSRGTRLERLVPLLRELAGLSAASPVPSH